MVRKKAWPNYLGPVKFDWAQPSEIPSLIFELPEKFSRRIQVIPWRYLMSATVMFLSHITLPTLLLLYAADLWSLYGCHGDTTDISNRQTPTESSAYAKTLHLLHDGWWNVSEQITKLIYFAQLLSFKDEIRLWTNLALQQYSAVWR